MMLINSSLDEKIAGSGANGINKKTKSSDKHNISPKKCLIETVVEPLIAFKHPDLPVVGEVSEMNPNALEKQFL
jgi:hypothetical protein